MRFVGVQQCVMKRLKLLFGIVLMMMQGSVFAEDNEFDLILVGGALSTCSSYSAKNCTSNKNITNGRDKSRFRFSKKATDRWLHAINYLEGNAKRGRRVENIYSLLTVLHSEMSGQLLSKSAFLDALDAKAKSLLKNGEFTRGLSDPYYFSLLDSHEVFQTDNSGKRLKEKVSVLDTTSVASKQIYAQFNAAVKRKVDSGVIPTVLVVTASSRDPFEAADFYQGAFSSIGINTVWLPLSAALQRAIGETERQVGDSEKKACYRLAELHAQHNTFDTARRYPLLSQQELSLCQHPEELLDLLSNAQGIFFNGGDQSRTRSALFKPDGSPSSFLTLLRSKVEEHSIVVGGTSAGTAVQAGGYNKHGAIPMLTNGTSEAAITHGAFALPPPSVRCADGESCAATLPGDALTYSSTGGTHLFPLGLLDTHFSERNREVRLAMATLSANQRFGFGVDETTALTVRLDASQAQFSVLGAGGVFVVDLANHQYQQSAKGLNSVQRKLGGLAHFWPAGTRAVLRNDSFNVDFSGIEDGSPKTDVDNGIWRAMTTKSCVTEQPVSWRADNYHVIVSKSDDSTFSDTGKYCGYTKRPFVISAR